MKLDLEATLRAAASGDQDAWRMLVNAYSWRIYSLIYRQCANAELAEEITQQTFVKVVEKLGSYKEQGRFDAWLFRIAINRLRDEKRRQKRQAVPTDFEESGLRVAGWEDSSPSPDEHAIELETGEGLRRAIAKLPDADKEVLHLRYVSDLAFNEIAQVLGQPLGTVLARNHRALRKLGNILEEKKE